MKKSISLLNSLKSPIYVNEDKTYIQITPLHKCEEAYNTAFIIALMYCNWAVKNNVAFEFTTAINGYYSIYLNSNNKNLKKESGIHRFCRISPFDPQKRRHTTFINVEINGKKNKTDSITSYTKSYVLHPFQNATNLKTNKKNDDVYGVLGGNLELLW